MKALKVFIKSFEALQGSVKITIKVNFYFNTKISNFNSLQLSTIYEYLKHKEPISQPELFQRNHVLFH